MKTLSQFFSIVFVFKSVYAIGDDASLNKKKLGESCISDYQCGSGWCDGNWLWNKECVECEEDSHCEDHGFSPMGEAPAAFCTKEKKCSKWKRGKPLDSKGYALNIDDLVWIPRKVINTATGLEIISFRLDDEPNSGITINENHVSVPMNVHLHGEYAMENYATEMKEAGIVNLFLGKNPVSVILDNPLFFAGMKYHALKVGGKTNTKSADRVKKEIEGRSSITNSLASSIRFQRDNIVAAATIATNAGSKLVEASQDIDHMNQIRAFVKLENGKKGVAELLASNDLSRLRDQAKDASILSKTSNSKKSMNHCRHWDSDSGVTVTDTHLIIPLETNLFAGSGQTEFSPARWFGVASGHTVFTYNEEDKALEMVQVNTEQMYVNMDSKVDQSDLTPAALWVGPADGKDMKVAEVDGRTDEYYDDSETSMAVKAVLATIDSMAPDYNRLYADPDAACTNEERKKFQESFEKAKTSLEDPSFIENMWRSVSVVEATTDSVDCGSVYLRTASKNSNAFDILEYAVWMHVIMETDLDHSVDLALNTHWWDYGVTLEGMDNDVKPEAVSVNGETI